MVEYEVKVNNSAAVDLDELARWAFLVARDQIQTTSNAMIVAKVMLKGETWRPHVSNPALLNPSVVPRWVTVKEISTPSKSISDPVIKGMLRRGADGDAVAAVNYCKLELAGEIEH